MNHQPTVRVKNVFIQGENSVVFLGMMMGWKV